MIQKIIFSLLLSVTFLLAQFNPSPYETTLQSVQNNKATIADNNIALGATGVVLHSFDNEHQTIISLATVIAKADNKLTLKFTRYKNLHQSALPSYKIDPKKGDKVILNYLYNRVLPITPNKETYKRITATFVGYNIIHPDLFASKLYVDHQPRPEKSDFHKSCLQNSNNLLLFAIEDKGYFVDCQSFKILDSINLSTQGDKASHPFYSRIPKIKTRLGAIMGSEDIGEYNRYYKQMLGLK